MQKHQKLMSAWVLMGAAMGVSAAELDGSAPLICATHETAVCELRKDCTQGPPESVNLPRFIRIDVSQSSVTSVRASGEERTSAIGSSSTNGGFLVLQGSDGSVAWSATIEQANGNMTLTASGEQMAFVAFGACTHI